MRRQILERLSYAVLLVLLGASLAMVVTVGRFYWQLQTNAPPVPGSTVDLVKEKLEAYDKRADQLERLLSLLLGLSTVYAFALALSAYQQLKDSAEKIGKLTREAEEKLQQLPSEIANLRREAAEKIGNLTREAEEKLKQLASEIARVRMEASEEIKSFALKIQEKFPLFADMDMAVRIIMDRLMRLLPVIDWSDEDEYYAKLTAQQKQEILFYEKTVAAFEYFDLKRLPDIGRTASEIYHGLGNFYGLKYVAEAKKDEETKERSRFYLDQALNYNAKNTGALNDRVFFALRMEQPPDLKTARKLLDDSLAADPDQQRAAYNLAWIEQGEKNFLRAEELLGKALAMSKWQKSPARDIQIQNLHYNRACARALLAGGETSPTKQRVWARQALEDLEDVFAPERGPYKLELVRCFQQDLKANGDLEFLAAHEPSSAAIDNISERLRQ